MPRRRLDHRHADLATTFYEPVYQRFRLPQEQMTPVLAFVNPISPEIKSILTRCGAVKDHRYRASCFTELWTIPTRASETQSETDLRRLDQEIVKAIGCLGGAYTADVGSLIWAPEQAVRPQKGWTSRLLEASVGRSDKSRL
jgi:hypothetical protein